MARFWTRKCRGDCGDNSFHDSHLTWFGRLYFKRLAR